MNKLLIALLAVFVLAVGYASAYPALVSGVVYDSDGVTPIDGASVTVTCEHDGINTTGYTVSGVNGEYLYQFLNTPDLECDFGDAVFVNAEFEGMFGSNTGNACDSESQCPIPVAVVDVTIPEFGLLGAMIVMLAGVGIVAYKRKN